MMDGCRLAVDIGGTFTDVVLETPEGYFSGKVLTTSQAPEGSSAASPSCCATPASRPTASA
jgi:N-methylhydantoinase A